MSTFSGLNTATTALWAQRRALDVTLAERPGYVVSGRAYDVTFVVRNRGNTESRVRLGARTLRQVRCH